MMADAMGPGLCVCIGLCQAKPPSHATQPLRFGIGFIVALVLSLSNAQWLVYKKELLPAFGRHVCMRGVEEVLCVCSCVVPLGSRRRGSWLPYICISSCHCSFLLVWWFRPFLHIGDRTRSGIRMICVCWYATYARSTDLALMFLASLSRSDIPLLSPLLFRH
jgi:hypothetical protein